MKGKVKSLKLVETHSLYLDEVIDIKFINENKQAIVCSNSETLKLYDLEAGTVELYPGHGDIIISLDKFHPQATDGTLDTSRGFILSGAKDS